MTEMEFFATFEFVPSVSLPARCLEVWKRNSGKYGEMTLCVDDYTVRVVGIDSIERVVGSRKSFAAAFRLLREKLDQC